MLMQNLRSPLMLAIAAYILLIAGAGFAMAGLSSVPSETVRPIQAMSYDLGSKRAVGYFRSVEGKCQLTLMIAETVDPDQARPASAARVKLALAPGQSAGLDSEEGASMVLTCGAQAATMEVKRAAPARS